MSNDGDAEESKAPKRPKLRQRIAVLHGTLDPITDVILIIAAEILSEGHAQEVWLVPAVTAPSKIPKFERMVMCHLAIESKITSTAPIYVVDADGPETRGELATVLRELQKMRPLSEFLLVCGIEHIANVHTWQEGDWLWNEVQWLLIRRSTTSVPACLPAEAVFLTCTAEDSPEEMRVRLKNDPTHGANGLIPLPVLSFIQRYGLYGVPQSPPLTSSHRVAVMGGSFSPPTLGHTQMAADLLHSGLTDEVLIVPCGPRPDKPSLDVPALERYIMCELAVADAVSPQFPVRVERMEVFLDQAMSSTQLGRALRERNPSHTYQMVFGADLYEESKSWGDGNFWEENDFLWVPRVGEHGSPLPANGPEKGMLVMPPKAVVEHRMAHQAPDVNLLPCTSLETSSLTIRNQYREGNLLAAAIGAGSRSVFSYWQRYKLYPSQ